MIKKYINNQKAFQRGSDNEDRSLVYRKWLRTVETNGYYCDIDVVKLNNGDLRAITELTRCDSESIPNENYFKAITSRWYSRDGQAEIIDKIADKLSIPAYLVVFNRDMKWFKVWSFNRLEWSQPMNPQEYQAWLYSL